MDYLIPILWSAFRCVLLSALLASCNQADDFVVSTNENEPIFVMVDQFTRYEKKLSGRKVALVGYLQLDNEDNLAVYLKKHKDENSKRTDHDVIPVWVPGIYSAYKETVNSPYNCVNNWVELIGTAGMLQGTTRIGVYDVETISVFRDRNLNGNLMECYIEVKSPPTTTTIKTVQTLLVSAGYYTGEINGVFDKKTLSAILQFQIDNALEPNGVINDGLIYDISTSLQNKGVR